ncbi:MAG TPA: hypothetical protein VFZ23_16580 [Pyrinomonadaceae bacterium]
MIWRSRIPAILYLIAMVLLAFAGVRHAASNYFAETAIEAASLEQTDTAAFFEPANPAVYEARGIILAKKRDFAGMAEAFERAAALRPNDYRLWLAAGDAWSQAGDVTAAEQAYLRAIQLAPGYGRPQMQLGIMYLGAGDNNRAFEFLSSAARLDPLYYPEVLHYASTTFGNDADAIERALRPLSKQAKILFALYLIDRSWMTETTRRFLVGRELTAEEKNKLINYLLSRKNYPLAREVWLSSMDSVRAGAAAQPLFDGGFESLTASDPSGLGWQIDDDVSFTSVSRTSKDVYSGASAIIIRFDGNADVGRPIISQIAFIEPGKRYRLTFYVRAVELVSAGLPSVLVTDVESHAILAWSQPVSDTKGSWIQRSVVFTAPPAPVVRVSVQRPECKASPCPIFGEFSVDEFSVAVDR